MVRVLAVDWGSKRIGLAVGETGFDVVTPRTTLPACGKLAADAENITKCAREEQADRIVVGVPENHEDDKMARLCRKLGAEIEALGWTVEYVDEGLTSVQAESRLAENPDWTAAQRKSRRDGEAACLILERYLHG